MRSRPIALRVAEAAALAAALVVAPAAGGAYAHDSVTVTAYPADARPGDEVEIRVQGCRGTTGAAKSRAFTEDAELSGGGGPHRPGGEEEEGEGREEGDRASDSRGSHSLSGSTALASRLSPGSYDVTVTCDGHDHRAAGALRVAGHHPDPGGPTPIAPVRAGGGGAAALAAGQQQEKAEGSGPSTSHTVVGLVLAGAAALAVAHRSSRRRRRTGPR